MIQRAIICEFINSESIINQISFGTFVYGTMDGDDPHAKPNQPNPKNELRVMGIKFKKIAQHAFNKG